METQSVSERQVVRLPDDIWQVIKDHYFDKEGVEITDVGKKYVEETCLIKLIDGVVFIANGNTFDLFVIPEKRGKWNIRKEINSFLNGLLLTHNVIKVNIDRNNLPSLRLASFFGFKEIDRKGNKLIMEIRNG